MIDMTPTKYLVLKIDGDYAILRRLEDEQAEPCLLYTSRCV